MASEPWFGSPAASSPPAWTIWKWSMNAVRLGEVAVAVDVVAVLLVERLEVGGDLRERLARVQLVLDPHGERRRG